MTCCRPHRLRPRAIDFSRACLWGVLALFFLVRFASAADTNLSPPRLTVAILPFEDQTGDREADHWAYSWPRLLRHQLGAIQTIRLRPPQAIEFCLQKFHLEPGDAISEKQARRMGEWIEARRVIWGTFCRHESQWQVTAHILNTASGRESAPLAKEGTNWLAVANALGEELAAVLGLDPSPTERRAMTDYPTKSAVAWEWFSRALAARSKQRPFPSQSSNIREALKADSKFAAAHLLWAQMLAGDGQTNEARAAFQQALRLDAICGEAHTAYAAFLIAQGENMNAMPECETAQRLTPDDPAPWERLGKVRFQQGRIDEALTLWNHAEALDPVAASIHARLGAAYIRQGDHIRALDELQEAERLVQQDVTTERLLCQAYDSLHKPSEALAHCQKYVALASRWGGDPATVLQFKKRARELQRQLVPQTINVPMPKVFTEEALEAALRARLTPEEMQLVVNPLAGSPAIKRVAETLTRGLKDDWAKARALFAPLTWRVDRGMGGSRTAREVFGLWNDPKISFRCQEYARLYVALARAVGLQSFFVIVNTNYQGMAVSHACAAVFVKGQGELVDPAYGWFGVPHQGFKVLDDLQAVAVYLHQQVSDIPRCRVAVKLTPDSAMAQFNLAFNLMHAQQLNEARLVLQTAMKLDSRPDLAAGAQGYLAVCNRDWPHAQAFLEKSLALNPNQDNVRFLLAATLQIQGKLREARAGYRDYLRHQEQPQYTDMALHEIAQINEALAE